MGAYKKLQAEEGGGVKILYMTGASSLQGGGEGWEGGGVVGFVEGVVGWGGGGEHQIYYFRGANEA